MLMRWFNKPEGDVLRWELSRRVREGSVMTGVVIVPCDLPLDWLCDRVSTRSLAIQRERVLGESVFVRFGLADCFRCSTSLLFLFFPSLSCCCCCCWWEWCGACA